jgi:hypothetical protein
MIAALALVVVGCSSATESNEPGASIGSPCAPRGELDPAFNDYDERTVILEPLSSPLRSGDLVCLTYHFRGRTTCPYGQAKDGSVPLGATPCTTPNGEPVLGGAVDPSRGREVRAQCADRRPADTVFWSCRCANTAGRTDDGDTYCACPGATSCQLVPSVLGADAMPGGYCVKNGSGYDEATACSAVCDPASLPCP